MKPEVIKVIEAKMKELKRLEYSRPNIQVAIDLCLDIKNEVNKLDLENDYDLRRFNRNWKISIDNFGGLTLDDEEYDDTPAFWEDAIKEMVFDVDGLLRHLRSK